jgi:hypothetical protein
MEGIEHSIYLRKYSIKIITIFCFFTYFIKTGFNGFKFTVNSSLIFTLYN